MKALGAIISAMLLASCGEPWSVSKAEAEASSAETAIILAQYAELRGEPVDRSALDAMPGLSAALGARAHRAREAVATRLKDPTSPIWGPMWTVDYFRICGTVNAKNSFGAYAGDEAFYVIGDEVFLGGNVDPAKWEQYCDGMRRPIILPD